MRKFDYARIDEVSVFFFFLLQRFEDYFTISQLNITFMNIPAFYSQLKISFIFVSIDSAEWVVRTTQNKINFFSPKLCCS